MRLEFKVNASEAVGGSVADLRSKKKGSLTSLSKLKGNVGGSLMNIGTKNSGGIKKFADSGEKFLKKIISKKTKNQFSWSQIGQSWGQSKEITEQPQVK